MGCVSSNLLNPNDDFTQLAGCHHHLVKLTSTTYGLLNLDPPLPLPPPSSTITTTTTMTPPETFTIVDKEPIKSEPEVINFWELMSGLETDTPTKPNVSSDGLNKENSDPNRETQPLDPKSTDDGKENRVVIYTTSLRGVRSTFDACNLVRAAIESFGVVICERDVSMDRGFREELTCLMAREREPWLLPRVFVKGEYIGGAEEVMALVEDGLLGDLLKEIPRKKNRGGGGGGGVCDGCGGLSFLPCSECNGSCKVVQGWGNDVVVVRCTECNENGLVRCPICS